MNPRIPDNIMTLHLYDESPCQMTCIQLTRGNPGVQLMLCPYISVNKVPCQMTCIWLLQVWGQLLGARFDRL